ncbi:UNVERIFIED_CONTAM: hypothetical protein HDU68_008922 [Siphonaria sp. JEL0065]|nr:hypothetical protein HDU68_008922 [Siphonaria sp. JEL0065]
MIKFNSSPTSPLVLSAHEASSSVSRFSADKSGRVRIEALVRLPESAPVKCVAWNNITENTFAFGSSAGRVLVANYMDDDEDASDTKQLNYNKELTTNALNVGSGRVSIVAEFAPKPVRPVALLTFAPVQNVLLVGLAKFRNEPCLHVWDTVSGSTVAQLASNEAVASAAWLNNNSFSFLAGIQPRWIRIYDLRRTSNVGIANDANNAAQINIATRFVHGLAVDPFDETKFASFAEGVGGGGVAVWDVRRTAVPVLHLDVRDGVALRGGTIRQSENRLNGELASREGGLGCLALTSAQFSSHLAKWRLRVVLEQSSGALHVLDYLRRLEKMGAVPLQSGTYDMGLKMVVDLSSTLLTRPFMTLIPMIGPTTMNRTTSSGVSTPRTSTSTALQTVPDIAATILPPIERTVPILHHERRILPSKMAKISGPVALSWVPLNNNIAADVVVTMSLESGSVKTPTLMHTPISSWSAHAGRGAGHSLGIAFGRGITVKDIGGGNEWDDDIASVIRRRALDGYALDIKHNLATLNKKIFSESSQDLIQVWTLLRDMKSQSRNYIAEGKEYSLLGIDQIVSDALSKNTSSTPTSGYPDMKNVPTIMSYFESYVSEFRTMGLRMCGRLFESDVSLELKLQGLEQNGNFEQAAGFALFYSSSLERALKSLNSSKDDKLRLVAAALAGYMAGSPSSTWVTLCQTLSAELKDPYLRSLFALMASNGDWYQVLEMTNGLQLHDKIGIALRFLPDCELLEYIHTTCKELTSSGDIRGLLLTGFTTTAGIDLLESYIDSTEDFQTCALIALSAASATANRVVEDSRVLNCYRNVLDQWQLFHERANLDISKSKLKTVAYVLKGTIKYGVLDTFNRLVNNNLLKSRDLQQVQELYGIALRNMQLEMVARNLTFLIATAVANQLDIAFKALEVTLSQLEDLGQSFVCRKVTPNKASRGTLDPTTI